MSKYHQFMREFNREKGYNSFYGSNKKDFQDAWERSKGASIAPRPEVAEQAGMGGEDINRAGEPFKKPVVKKAKPKRWFFNVNNYREAQKYFRSNYNGATNEFRGPRAPNGNLYDEGDWTSTTDGGNTHSRSSPLLKLAKYLQKEGIGEIRDV